MVCLGLVYLASVDYVVYSFDLMWFVVCVWFVVDLFLVVGLCRLVVCGLVWYG